MDGPETSDDKEKYEVTSQTTSEEILSKDKNDQQKSNTTKKDATKKLVVTNLWNRGLSSIPKQLLALNTIQWLNISHNRLSSIPNELCISLNNLEHLFVGFNQLTTLPMDIRFLHHLKELVLDHNAITSVPKELFWCTNLTHLYLPFNQLYWLPKDVANLSKLKVLSLSFNNLVTLPSELSKLENLIELHIRNNPFEPLVLEELAPHTPRKTQDVLEYLKSELPAKPEKTTENGTDDEEEEDEDSDDENELLEWLRLFQLQDLYVPLQEVGVEEIEDLHFLGENDLDHIEPADQRDRLLNRIFKDNAYANNNKYSLYQ